MADGAVVATAENTPWIARMESVMARRASAIASADAIRGCPAKASDIPDVRLLSVLNSRHHTYVDDPNRDEMHGPDGWHFTWCLEEHLVEFPSKAIIAKCRALIRRGLMEGCCCGCRGDFELTDAGPAYLMSVEGA